MKNFKPSDLFLILILAPIIVIPCVFSHEVGNIFITPKFSFLIFYVGLGLILLSFIFLYPSLITSERKVLFKKRLFHPVTISLLLYILTVLVATAFSQLPEASFWGSYFSKMGALTYIAHSVIYFFIILFLNPRDLKKIIALLWIPLLIISVFAVLEILKYPSLDYYKNSPYFPQRTSSTFGAPLHLANFIAISLPLAISSIFFIKTRALQILAGIMIVILISILSSTLTRGAYLAVFLSLICYFYFFRRFKLWREIKLIKIRLEAWAIFSLILVLIISVFANPDFINRIKERHESSIYLRAYIWRDTFKLIRDYPLLGTGPDTLQLTFLPYKSKELHKSLKQANRETAHAHNQYLHIWATQGIFSSLSFILFLFFVFKSSLINARRTLIPRNMRLIALGVCVGTIAYSLVVFTGIENVTLLIFLNLFAGISVIIPTQSSKLQVFVTKKLNIYKDFWGSPFMKIPARGSGFILFLTSGLCLLYISYSSWHADYYSGFMVKPVSVDRKIESLKKSVSLAPYESLFSLFLSYAYYEKATTDSIDQNKTHALDQAETLLTSNIRKTLFLSKYVILLSDIYLKKKEYLKAEVLIKSQLPKIPYDDLLKEQFFKTLILQKKFDDLLQYVDDWVADFPGNAKFHWYKGNVEALKVNYKAAEAEYLRAIELTPQSGQYKNSLRILKNAMQRSAERKFLK